jgi:hypothetical protein
MRPVLIEMLTHGTEGLDDFLEKSNRNGANCDIWSSMDDDEIEILADTFLKLGRRTTVAAGIVRMTATGYLNIQAALILLPRLWQTATWYPRNGGIRL